MKSFEYIAKKLGGKEYTVRIQKPNQPKDKEESIRVFGVLQLMQKTSITAYGEQQTFDGRFFTNIKLPNKKAETLLLENNNKVYCLLTNYDLSVNQGILAKAQHCCYRLEEYNDANK